MGKNSEVLYTSTIFVPGRLLEIIKQKALEKMGELKIEQTAPNGNKLVEFSFKNSMSRQEWEEDISSLVPKPLVFFTATLKITSNYQGILSRAMDKLHENKGWEFKMEIQKDVSLFKVCFKDPIQRTLWEIAMESL